MPRNISLRLETMGKSRAGYKTDPDTATLLKRCGWTVARKGRSYWYLQPPSGQVGSRIIEITVPAPTDDEIIATANEMHLNALSDISSSRMLHGWPVVYRLAQRQSVIITDVDPFTGSRGESETRTYKEGAVCRIGFMLIWQAEVTWPRDGQTILTKYPKREIPPPDAGLYGKQSALPDVARTWVVEESTTFSEGAMQSSLVDTYERNPAARQACIDHYGARCHVCGFDFGQRYGEIGRGFIHVHHIRPLSEIGEQYKVSPIDDLRPVCPNCHAMLHRTSPPLGIDQLKSRMERECK